MSKKVRRGARKAGAQARAGARRAARAEARAGGGNAAEEEGRAAGKSALRPPADPRDALAVADRLHSGAIRVLRAVRVADDETGLSAPKLSALSVLVFGGPQSLGSLARAEQVTAATMSKLASDLEAEGLLEKRADARDRRGLRIAVTAKGRALLMEGRKRRLALLKARVATLSAAERAALARAAEIMLRLGAMR